MFKVSLQIGFKYETSVPAPGIKDYTILRMKRVGTCLVMNRGVLLFESDPTTSIQPLFEKVFTCPIIHVGNIEGFLRASVGAVLVARTIQCE